MSPASVEATLALAIQHYNGGRREAAETLCRALLLQHATQPALMQQQPGHVPALVNLGIVPLDQGRLDAAMQRFGQALRQRPEAFGRIAGARGAESTGALWLHAADLRAALEAAA